MYLEYRDARPEQRVEVFAVTVGFSRGVLFTEPTPEQVHPQYTVTEVDTRVRLFWCDRSALVCRQKSYHLFFFAEKHQTINKFQAGQITSMYFYSDIVMKLTFYKLASQFL